MLISKDNLKRNKKVRAIKSLALLIMYETNNRVMIKARLADKMILAAARTLKYAHVKYASIID